MEEQSVREYHISNIESEKTLKHFQWYEEQHPFPQSVVPNIPQDAKSQLGTVDKLAQSVIPRLVDKLNAGNWRLDRIENLADWQTACIMDIYNLFNETYIPILDRFEERVKTLEAQLVKKQSKSRKKKDAQPKEPELDISEIADYNPDTDTWEAMTIDGHRITGALIDVVEHLNGAADQMYSDELIQFIANLEPQVKKAIAKRFPN